MSLVVTPKIKLRICDVHGSGLDKTLVKFEVFLNGNLCQKTEEAGNDFFELPRTGKLRVLVLDGAEKYLASMQMSLEVLPCKGKVLVPLACDALHDCVEKIPTNSTSPRILLQVVKKHDTGHWISKENLKLLKENIKSLQTQLKITQDAYTIIAVEKAELQKSFEELQLTFQEHLQKTEDREASILKLLEQKDQALENSFKSFHTVKSKYKSLKAKQKILSVEESLPPIALFHELNQELNFFRNKVESLKTNELKLSTQLHELGQTWLESSKPFTTPPHSNKENTSNSLQSEPGILQSNENFLKPLFQSEKPQKAKNKEFELSKPHSLVLGDSNT